jgi:glycosyltransferase involved in cell wall biosynthesis
MSRAAGRGHDVLFIETGDFLGRHLWRLVRGPDRRSLARRLTVGEVVAPRIRVRKLRAWFPLGQRHELANTANWVLGRRMLARATCKLAPPRIAWIYDPRSVLALGALGEAFGVYDCVDDYSQQADRPRSRDLLAAADRRAAERSRLVFATARPLYDRHIAVNAKTYLVQNVGDFDHFSPAAERATADDELLELPRPVIGFAGNLDPGKVDFDVLRTLAEGYPLGTVLLAGPVRDGARAALHELVRRPNVRWLGLRRYEELPQVVAAFDVALIPYAENPYTKSCFPLKVFEYLAAGKPVVATGLPELSALEPHVLLAQGAVDILPTLARALDGVDRGREGRIALASRNTWETRTSRLLELVDGELTE